MKTFEMARTYILRADNDSDATQMLYSVYPFLRHDKYVKRTWKGKVVNGYKIIRYYLIEAEDDEVASQKFYSWFPELKEDRYLTGVGVKQVPSEPNGWASTLIGQIFGSPKRR